ncbi:uncharacterized protein FYN12_010991 isoform 2-T2 [Phoenicopterus ruber ruber]
MEKSHDQMKKPRAYILFCQSLFPVTCNGLFPGESMERCFSRVPGLKPACYTREPSQLSSPAFPGEVPSLSIRLALLAEERFVLSSPSFWNYCLSVFICVLHLSCLRSAVNDRWDPVPLPESRLSFTPSAVPKPMRSHPSPRPVVPGIFLVKSVKLPVCNSGLIR